MANVSILSTDGTEYNVKDTAARQDIAKIKSMVTPLRIISRGTKTTLFNISSAEGNTSGKIVYTITAVQTGTVYAVSDYEVGDQYAMYTLTYSSGSGNTGTSATNYRFDSTIVSEETGDFACFVCDRSDYKMKVISAAQLNANHRVIAMFYGRAMSLINNIDTFGNDCLFNIPQRGFRKIYIANVGAPSQGALTWTKSDNVYTITRNSDAFAGYGVDESRGIQIGIGAPEFSGVNYPFPETLSSASALTGYACIVCKPDDTTTSTWEIISPNALNNNINKYLVLGFLYNTYGMFFTEQCELLFTNFTSNSSWKTYYVSKDALWDLALCNTVTLANGTVTLNPSAHTVTIVNPIIAPTSLPGGFTVKTQTYVVDYSEDEHPTYLKFICWDWVNNTFISISSDSDSSVRQQLQAKKSTFSVLCAVYYNRFVYTCGACQPGMWYVNDTDIYKPALYAGKDLFKAFRKVGVIGDSLSVGYMMNKSTGVATSRMLQYSWPKTVMRDAGGMPWLNLGTSGQSVLTWCSSDTYGMVQAEASGNKCQAYIIGLGENDCSSSSRGIPLGSPSDIVDNYQTVATTYYGGYARIIQILKHLNPDCKIFCLTNPRSGTARANYNVAVRYIADTYYASDSNVILVDLANDYSPSFNTGFLPADDTAITGGHYSADGYVRIASILEDAISNAMEANVATMENIAFITYDTGDPTPNTMTE